MWDINHSYLSWLCAGRKEKDPICRLTEAELKNHSFIAGKRQNKTETGTARNCGRKQSPQVWGTTWQRAGTHADTKYRRGTGQRADTWETRLTLITQTRWGRANRTSRTQTEDYQSKTVSTLNFTDSDPQVDTTTTRTWQQREQRHVGPG